METDEIKLKHETKEVIEVKEIKGNKENKESKESKETKEENVFNFEHILKKIQDTEYLINKLTSELKDELY